MNEKKENDGVALITAPGQCSKSSAETASGLFANVPNASNPDDDTYLDRLDDEADDEVIIGYECLGCGNTQASNGWGGRCDACDGLSLEPMHY